MKGLIYTLLLLFMPLVASADNGLRCAKNVFSQPNVRFIHKIEGKVKTPGI